MNYKNIPFVDLKLQNISLKRKFVKNFNDILENSNYIKGKYNQLLEKKICEIFKCKYSLNVNSGTDALIIAIKSLNLKSKSEIITTSNTWISSAYAIELNNCKPVFVDVDPHTFQIDANLADMQFLYVYLVITTSVAVLSKSAIRNQSKDYIWYGPKMAP